MFYSDLRHTRLAYAVFATEAGQEMVRRARQDTQVQSFFMQMLETKFGPNPDNSIMHLQALWVGKTRLGPALTASLMVAINGLPRQPYLIDAGLVQEPASIYWLLLSLQQLVWRAHKNLELQVELENGDLAVFETPDPEFLEAGITHMPRIITKRERLAQAIHERFGFDPMHPPMVAETWGNFWTTTQRELYKDKP